MTFHDTFNRLEGKVDVLTDAISRLVLFEERQAVQSAAILDLASRTGITERKLDMWINRAAGGWAVLGILGTILVTLAGLVLKGAHA